MEAAGRNPGEKADSDSRIALRFIRATGSPYQCVAWMEAGGRNPGKAAVIELPDFAALHPGYGEPQGLLEARKVRVARTPVAQSFDGVEWNATEGQKNSFFHPLHLGEGLMDTSVPVMADVRLARDGYLLIGLNSA